MSTFQSVIKVDKRTGVYQNKKHLDEDKNQPKCQKINRGKSNPPIHKKENKDVGEINEAPIFVAIMKNLKKG